MTQTFCSVISPETNYSFTKTKMMIELQRGRCYTFSTDRSNNNQKKNGKKNGCYQFCFLGNSAKPIHFVLGWFACFRINSSACHPEVNIVYHLFDYYPLWHRREMRKSKRALIRIFLSFYYFVFSQFACTVFFLLIFSVNIFFSVR